MSLRLRSLPEDTLRALADAIGSGRLGPPWRRDAVERTVRGPEWLADELATVAGAGRDPGGIAWALRMLVEDRADGRARWDGIELCWTGPDDVVTETRDTGAVARQLFGEATRTLLVATYALDSGPKAAALLAVLRERMLALPDLRVTFFVNHGREHGDDRATATILRERATWFTEEVWPWNPRPQVFYDRRAMEPTLGPKACLHAKCIVRDEEQTLVTSANLTEAAQERNIEAGVIIADGGFARKVTRQFETLVERGYLVGLNLGRAAGVATEGRARG